MIGTHGQDSEYHKSRQSDTASVGLLDREDNRTHSYGVGLASLPGLLGSAHIGASYHTPVRAEAMTQMQHTHGNRAAQRFIQRSPQGAGPEQEEESGWPRWLNSLPGALRTLALHLGNTPAPTSTPTHATSPTLALGEGGSPDGPLFPDLSDQELDDAFRRANAPTGFELPGQNPDVVAPGQPANGPRIGLQGDPAQLVVPEDVPRTGMRQTTVGENPNAIAYHENMEFRNLGDPVLDAAGNPVMRPDGSPLVNPAPHPRTEVRYHTANPNAPAGSYSQTNPTIQVNTHRGSFRQLPDGQWMRGADMNAAQIAVAGPAQQTQLYRLPDGQWMPIGAMTDAERAAAHYPAGGSDIPETTAPAPNVDAPLAAATSSNWRNAFRPGGAVDHTLRGSSYGFQFFGNLARGQDLGEATTGALAGGYTNNAIGSKMSPKGGLVDMGINLANTGLQLLGAPEEVTTVTQTVADATPSSFGTSVASNTARGLWNTGKGLLTGDWAALKKQGEGILQGKEGAPLQGYAAAGEAAYALISGDDEMLDRIREENASGKRGKLAQWGSRIGRKAREWTDSLGEYDEMDAYREGGPEAAARFRKMTATREQREEAVLRDRFKRKAEEQKRDAAFNQEIEHSMAIARGEAAPYVPMDFSVRPQIPTNYDEDGEPLPPVSMRLP